MTKTYEYESGHCILELNGHWIPANQIPHYKNYESKTQRLNDFAETNLHMRQNHDPDLLISNSRLFLILPYFLTIQLGCL